MWCNVDYMAAYSKPTSICMDLTDNFSDIPPHGCFFSSFGFSSGIATAGGDSFPTPSLVRRHANLCKKNWEMHEKLINHPPIQLQCMHMYQNE